MIQCLRKYNNRIMFIIILIVISFIRIQALTPDTTKEIVYGLSLWNAEGFSKTFCPQEKDEIHVIADSYNVINIKKMQVYYWPLTKEYKLKSSQTDKSYEGTLEIVKRDEVINSIEMNEYTYKVPDTNNFKIQELITGQEAKEVFENYKHKVDEYYTTLDKYEQERKEYYDKLKELMQKKNVKKEDLPKKPVEPISPGEYVYEPQRAFILNVSEGEYLLRLKDKSGNIIEGTEKKLIAFTSNREGINYNILPEDKWNKPQKSDELKDTLYTQGKNTVFLQAFGSVEYPEMNYSNLSELNQVKTYNSQRYIWVRLKRLHQGKMQLLKKGKVIKQIQEKPYYVKQTSDYTAGFNIIEWSKELIDTTPTFWGFKVDIENGNYTIRMIDDKGNILSGSERNIQSIDDHNINLLFIISLIPFIIVAFVVGVKNLWGFFLPQKII